MVNIGPLRNKKESNSKTITLEGLYLAENIFEKDFTISGKLYKIDIQSAIKFFKPINELTDVDIDDAIDNISSHRFTFISIQADLEQIISKKERELNNWMYQQQGIIKRNFESSDVRTPKRLSDKEVFSRFIQNEGNRDRYNKDKDEIDFFKNQLTLVINLNKILEQRGWFLRTWAENRLLIKRGRGRESAI